MEPRCFKDFVPFLQLTPDDLVKIQKKMINERDQVPEGNRVYYFSKALNVPPELVTKHFASHIFIFDVRLKHLIANLDLMLEYGITSENILNDLWAFRYLTTKILSRFQRIKTFESRTLRLWMIRCKKDVLQRSINLSQEKQEVFGDETVVDYLSKRLGFDIETTERIVAKQSLVKKVNARKMKEILDYLLIEEKFEANQVATAIQILCHSLKKIKSRIQDLKKVDYRFPSLNILCHSTKYFNKLLSDLTSRKSREANTR